MTKKFIYDSSEFVTTDLTEFRSFVAEREKNQKWFTDEDNTKADMVRFMPVFPEPLCVPSEVDQLRRNKMVKFTSSEDAYTDTMYSPEFGVYGSTQLICVNGELYPVGMSAVRGIISRAGTAMEGFEKLRTRNPQKLSENLNNYLSETDGSLCVLVGDEKVRAVNSGRYAICSIGFVLEATFDWISKEYPQAFFVDGYYCHDFASWDIDLSAYTNEILGQFQELVHGGFKPALRVTLSNTAKSSVSLKPCLRLASAIFPVGESIDCPHIKKGCASERTLEMEETIRKNFSLVFPSLTALAADINDLKNVTVNNASNALLRGMKKLALPKQQALEAQEQFAMIFADISTAYDCFLSVVDTYTFVIRDNPNDPKKIFASADAVGRAVKIEWRQLGSFPGDFSW